MPERPAVHRPAGFKTRAEQRQAYDAARGSRLYNYRWQQLRAAYLAQHPLCQCEANGGAGCGYPATVVDHHTPHRGDLGLMFAWSNLRAMTKACHDRKTASRDGGFGNPMRSAGR
jgi:5-methylcytosine-specific restriction enzyme A